VGTDGILGGQAVVPNIAGTWKDLTDNVNFMAENLTNQVRGIVKVVTAVAEGDLEQKFSLAAKGEVASLADTINDMTRTLATFADQVIGVAKEVGVEGKLGGQAEVPGAAGTWKDLVNNVNTLANNWSTQVRAIADVAIAVTQGDLSQKITVDARGEVNDLKTNINTMIKNIRTTTLQNEEQYWLKTNLAKFTGMLQGQNDLNTVARMLMSELAPVVKAQHGVFYLMETDENEHRSLGLLASYAYQERKNLATHFEIGEGIVGQCAYEKQRILLTNVPGDYIQISSGLGESTPLNLIVLPVMFEGDVKAVIELASFNLFSQTNQMFLEQTTESLGVVLNTIEANMRTEQLLEQSQSMSEELQSQSEELLQTNVELEEKARMLEEQKQEVEQAKLDVEEKAEQLALTSKYKSQFLSSMSHELRTPLNSLLLLSRQLADNPEGNLNDKQIDFATTIQESGNDLLTLLNDILDLSKIESGTVTVEVVDVVLADLKDEIERTFKQSADSKKLGFSVKLDDELPPVIRTDGQRLRQVLKNLISNSLKFTETGRIDLEIAMVSKGWNIDNAVLNRADIVIAFAVKDTGIGIAKDKQNVVFGAFQQADGTTTRKYGGTGLGLTISREIAQLLGGDLGLTSTPGEGCTFTLYLQQNYLNIPEKIKNNIVKYPAAHKDKINVDVVESTKKQKILSDICVKDAGLKGKTVLIVDDDIRNVFALTSVMERNGMDVKSADSGEAAIARLEENDSIGAVLMDVMMPGMDGYEAMRRIRKQPKFESLPIVALTAKAMEGDREKCISAGASDYIAKPVDADQLLSLLRAWMDKQEIR
jgi:signal transduction histidine kinase/HAMP domain-containing protein/ActR/RegA family two-component response regulator